MIDPKETIKFFRVQLSRAKINLKGAQDRRDERAINNIKHKIEVYEYTIALLRKSEEDVT